MHLFIRLVELLLRVLVPHSYVAVGNTQVRIIRSLISFVRCLPYVLHPFDVLLAIVQYWQIPQKDGRQDKHLTIAGEVRKSLVK